MILVAGWYSLKIVRLKTESIWMAVGVLVYYFALLGRYTSFSGDVNLAIISSCFIPIFIYYFEIRKYTISFVIFVLSLFSRENIPLWFIFIFIVLIIQNFKNKKAVLFGFSGIFISIIYFILLFKLFIPAVELPDKPYSLFNYSALGSSPGEAVSFILSHPIESMKMFFVNHLDNPLYDGIKIEFYWVYLISGGIVLLLRPQYLIWFIPIVAQKVLNDAPIRWGIASYYSIEVVTLLPLSVFIVLSTIKHKALQNSLILAVCIAAFGVTIHKLDLENCRAKFLMNPPKEKFYDKRYYEKPFNIRKVNKLLSLIPNNAKVSASNSLLPHLAQRQNIYFFPTVNDAEYLVLSVIDHYYLMTPYENELIRQKFLSNLNWEVVSVEYPVFLLKCNETPSSTGSALDVFWGHSDTLFCDYEQHDSVNGKVLFSNGDYAENMNKLSTELFYSKERSVVLAQKDTYSSAVKIDVKNQLTHIKVNVWCSSNAEKGFIVASGENGFYKASFESDSIDSSGWCRLVLGFWIPKNIDGSTVNVYLGSNTQQPVYFDDLQIIKHYQK
jgi:uncharacterized membrane protein